MDNMASENLDRHSNDEGIQQLHILIKELKYRDPMHVEYLQKYLRENEATSQLLSDEQIIENFMGNDKEKEVEDNSYVLDPVSYKDALKAKITLHKFSL